MNKAISLLLLTVLTATAAWGQKEKTTLFAVGRANQYDTYLSPLEYDGPTALCLFTTERPLKRRSTMVFQSFTQVEYSYAHNQAGTADYHAGAIHFDAGWSRRWMDFVTPNLRFSAGGLFGCDAGGIYNTRNTNNPAQARVNIHFSATLGAAYSFNIRKQNLRVRYHVDMPLIGAMFSPQYGQSYYNIFSQGNYDHNIVCTHPGNALSLRHYLVLDIPIKRRKVCVGYISDLRQSKPHHLRQHQYTRALLIGWTL